MPPRGRRPSRGKVGENEGSSSGDAVTDTSKVAMFCFCVAAIYGAYITQGVLQEKMYVTCQHHSPSYVQPQCTMSETSARLCMHRSTSKYGTEQQRFDHLTFLNLSQCFVCFVWSFISK
jgi:UDP-galactose transporter B1